MKAPEGALAATPPARAVLTLLLALLAVAGNYLAMPLFFGVDFIFGSVAVMLAARLLGTVPAVLVAVAGGAYTLVLWGHPYALVIFVLEALFVAQAYRHRLRNLVTADLAYWLLLGVPLVLIFYRGMIGLGWEATLMIALKQALNGLFNALLAGLAVIALQLGAGRGLRSRLGRPGLTELLFHVLLALSLLAGATPVVLEGRAARAQQETFMAERLNDLARLIPARLAAEPVRAEALPGATIEHAPLGAGMGVALLDPDDVAVAFRGEVKTLSKAGNFRAIDGNLRIWLPDGSMAAMQRWKEGRYVVRLPVDGVADVWHVLVEAPAASVVRALESQRVGQFVFLAGLVGVSVLASGWLSRWIGRPLGRLDEASSEITRQVEAGVRPVLPGSAVHEYASLGQTLQEVSARLADSFQALRLARDGLASQVEARTQDLARSAEQLRNVLAAASEFSIIATDVEGTITLFNRGSERLLGYAAQDVVGRHTPALIHVPEEVAARAAELRQAFGRPVEGFAVFVEVPQREGSETREWTYVRRDGERVPVSLTVSVQRDGEGRLVGYLGIAQDISERKQAQSALAEQALHTQAILDNMVDGIVTIDRAGIVQSFNPAAERIFGYPADAVVGRNVSMLMPSPHRESHDSYLRNYEATAVARIIGIGREVEGQRRDGSLFPMDLAVSEISRQGRPLYVGMVRDISERKRMERMKNEFVATVSHELRTPLTAISGALGLVASGALGELPDKACTMVDIAYRNSQRLNHLINDLLDMEKMTAGRMNFAMRIQPLLPLIEQALESHRTYGLERRVTLRLEGRVHDVAVRVDGQRLMQVMANLLSNAIKFSHEGGVVRVAIVPAADHVRVVVADEGPGIPETFRSRVFEKFSQADASDTRKKGGTGLGLAISRELVERMSGRIGFDSVEDAGATFWFELPLAREVADAALDDGMA